MGEKYRGKATISRNGAQVDVICSYETNDSGALASWDGIFTLFSLKDEGTVFESFLREECVITLPDERSAAVLVELDLGSKKGRILGTGPPPG